MLDSGENSAIDPGDRRWLAAQTLPHKQALAEINLKQQGFVTFLPRAAFLSITAMFHTVIDLLAGTSGLETDRAMLTIYTWGRLSFKG